MAMAVLNVVEIDRFIRKHRNSRQWLRRWVESVRRTTWNSITDVRKDFPSVDGVPIGVRGGQTIVVTVFNVKGNEYRLISRIVYAAHSVAVLAVLTHQEYDR